MTGLEQLDFHTSWKIIEEKYRKTILTEKLEIRIIELSKITNLLDKDDELLDWLFFLDNPNSERVINKMKENNALKQAAEKLDKISQDEHMRRIAEWREKAIIEENTAISAGFERGREAKAKEIAIKLLKNGLDIKFVQQATDLPIEEIKMLQQNLD